MSLRFWALVFATSVAGCAAGPEDASGSAAALTFDYDAPIEARESGPASVVLRVPNAIALPYEVGDYFSEGFRTGERPANMFLAGEPAAGVVACHFEAKGPEKQALIDTGKRPSIAPNATLRPAKIEAWTSSPAHRTSQTTARIHLTGAEAAAPIDVAPKDLLLACERRGEPNAPNLPLTWNDVQRALLGSVDVDPDAR